MSESYVELYKKHYPRTWSDMIGQEVVARSLKNSVKNKTLPTAYAFLGPRGCGKTSSAKLLAKAINCLNPPEAGESCNECDVCQGINANAQSGVHYLSMAHYGKAEDVRALEREARLASPIKQRVFILDEVHNLSKQAWDSLLIPLEAVDMPALFILCSTEGNKIPAPIMSRVRALKFKLVDDTQMSEYVRGIADKEGLDLSDNDIEHVVFDGRGSVRDTLSALDTFLTTGIRHVSYGDKLIAGMETGKLMESLKAVADADSNDVDIVGLAEQTFNDVRDILLRAAGVGQEIVPTIPTDDPQGFYRAIGGREGILFLLETLGDSITRMYSGGDPRILLEVALVRSHSFVHGDAQ